MYRGLLDRQLLRAVDGVKYFQGHVETPLHQRSSECVFLEIFSFHPNKKRKHRHGQIGKFALLLKRFMGCLDGHVAVVHHE